MSDEDIKLPIPVASSKKEEEPEEEPEEPGHIDVHIQHENRNPIEMENINWCLTTRYKHDQVQICYQLDEDFKIRLVEVSIKNKERELYTLEHFLHLNFSKFKLHVEANGVPPDCYDWHPIWGYMRYVILL